MTGLSYADPEILVGEWLKEQLAMTKVWMDPSPPPNAWTTAAWLWVQRAQGGEALALTLDDVLLDIGAYAANADHARKLANKVWPAMTLDLPRTTFESGVFVTGVTCTVRPFWAPDPKFRREATYRVILHGLI
ncbi:hypothetical protein [Paractinoplanes toevensis]|uniref:Uncharacterized protein n=1 Tax=Paractinoplanes toevensis TaxID=571911 RepID=A0A919T495_9ACTN|nr:hypothetical protein [Actinoplanes toevensis]GIM88755.1 hypothetical protein Ato02nite_005480 [Actinoplanes toevensis]